VSLLLKEDGKSVAEVEVFQMRTGTKIGLVAGALLCWRSDELSRLVAS